MKQYLCTQMFLLFALLPALVLCMVTPQEENSTRKRPLPLDIVESPVPAEQVTALLGDNVSPSSPVPVPSGAKPAELITDADGPVSNVASYLDAADFYNLMHSSKALRKSSFFYSKKAIRIPLDATEDAVRRMISSNKHIEKVTIDFNPGHLMILQDCPELRHLIVKQETTDVLDNVATSTFMNMLSTFGNLKTLKILNYYGSVEVDIAPLASLTQLTEIWLHLPGLVNITALSTMTQLTKLTIAETSVSDISPLSALTHLKELTISSANELVDLTPLIGLKRLTKLNLSGCRTLTEISPEHLTELTVLNLVFCSGLVDISPMKKLTRLAVIYMSFCTQLVNIAPLSGLTNLRVLSLRNTKVFDISPLSGLYQLTELNLDRIPIWGRSRRVVVSSLDHLTQLVINWG
jgi:Leucine-rich repeat (LRR) protein